MVNQVMVLWLALNGLLVMGGAYLIGSVPPGYWVGRWLKGIDIREHGSGSTGATNVLRTVGKVPALVVLLVDVLKGAVAIAAVHWFYTFIQAQAIPVPTTEIWLPWMVTLAGIAALLGHSKSIFLGFTGGKSVATSLGVLLAISWTVGLGTLAVFAVVLAATRIVSLSSIVGAIAVSGFMLLTHQPLPYILFGLSGGLYVILRHRSNIQRLLTGSEPQLGQTVPNVQQSPLSETGE